MYKKSTKIKQNGKGFFSGFNVNTSCMMNSTINKFHMNDSISSIIQEEDLRDKDNKFVYTDSNFLKILEKLINKFKNIHASCVTQISKNKSIKDINKEILLIINKNLESHDSIQDLLNFNYELNNNSNEWDNQGQTFAYELIIKILNKEDNIDILNCYKRICNNNDLFTDSKWYEFAYIFYIITQELYIGVGGKSKKKSLDKCTVSELKERANKRGIKVSGLKKAEIIDKLRNKSKK